MITKAQITRRAALDKIPAKTAERDYVLAHVIPRPNRSVSKALGS